MISIIVQMGKLFNSHSLVFKSGYIPGILGVLLIIGGLGYLIDFFAFFLFPNVNATISQFTFLGELLLPLWLLIKGVNVERWVTGRTSRRTSQQ